VALLFSSKGDDPALWEGLLRRHVADLDFRVWPDNVGDAADIEFALVWRPKLGALREFPNLKAIFSLGAGVDHIFRDPDLPPGVPIVRLIDAALTRGMSEYVLHWALHFHRNFHRYARQQREGIWKQLPLTPISETSVGVMGLGELGGDAAAALAGLGFRVAGWSRGPKKLEGVECFHGHHALEPFLGLSQILVCLLPLTPETEGILHAGTLARLPRGGYLINPARGALVAEEDLLAALDSGHIAGAVLDVFRAEPLAPGHPFWSRPGVTVTPHVASITDPRSAAREIAANMERIEKGEPPVGVADPETGY